MNNPSINIVELINKNNKHFQNFALGKIFCVNPLKVIINNNEFDRSDILINFALINNTNNTVDYYFNINDKVVFLISDDMQDLILLCKVV